MQVSNVRLTVVTYTARIVADVRFCWNL